jgi:L-ascorbate metabolism protein UlaG (beta-lactamase superfamily)
MKITLVGQSTFIIETVEGIIILTDPWFHAFGFLRSSPPALEPDEITKCDLLLVSHNHVDHFDRAGIGIARRTGALIIGSARAAKKARRAGIGEAIGLAPTEKTTFKSLSITAVHAEHPLAKDAIGFNVRGRESFYFSGDTRHSEKIVRELEDARLDVAILQIACAKYFGRKDGMDIHDSAKLANELMPNIVVPMHYQHRGKTEDPGRMKALVKGPRVVILEPGVRTEVTAGTGK